VTDQVDVLIVGAGPTGLALAAQLVAHGVRPRLVDRGRDRVHESRALAIQPRTLEVLAGFGVTDQLVGRGNTAVELHLHVDRRVRTMPMFDLGLDDTAYPYLLFLSQADTEDILQHHVQTSGVTVERGVELVDLRTDGEHVTCRLRHDNGGEETVTAGYVVGCDGAHSAVRRSAGIPFQGSSYPQTFVLADVEADGIPPDAAHVFLSDAGMLFFFPLGRPASWRLLVMRPPTDPTPADAPVKLDEVQHLADTYTNGTVALHDPVWMTNFRLHHRAAARYRAGRVFLAGDAAHIHSPAGAQGMNTGIQDAVNLGWKLAHTICRLGPVELLDTYEPERSPIGRAVLRFTDRAFTVATSTNPLVRFARTRVAPAVIPLAARSRAARGYALRTVSQLGIRYRRSPLSTMGPGRPRRGPRPGDRLPDAPIVGNGDSTTLHQLIGAPGWHLLLCGPSHAWNTERISELVRVRADALTVHRISARAQAGTLSDPDGRALRRLGLDTDDAALYLVRPDGHVGFRSGTAGLAELAAYLNRWLGRR
jgi:2-polyprenyl-6-methoxyphenol hydroxylase-like FAD-dependent oxidoreductase